MGIWKKIQCIQRSLLQATVGTMLALYVMGSFPEGSLHALFHSKEVSEIHSSQHENDACHKSLFHADVVKGCAHKMHLVNGSKCAFAQIGHQPTHIGEQVQQLKKLYASDIVYVQHKSAFISEFGAIRSARAPPLA